MSEIQLMKQISEQLLLLSTIGSFVMGCALYTAVSAYKTYKLL